MGQGQLDGRQSALERGTRHTQSGRRQRIHHLLVAQPGIPGSGALLTGVNFAEDALRRQKLRDRALQPRAREHQAAGRGGRLPVVLGVGDIALGYVHEGAVDECDQNLQDD